jgi:hypothetical protein
MNLQTRRACVNVFGSLERRALFGMKSKAVFEPSIDRRSV